VEKTAFFYLTPLIPLSFKGEGEKNLKEGRKPLLNIPEKINFCQTGVSNVKILNERKYIA